MGKHLDEIKIRRLERSDVPAVLAIQSRSTEISQWSHADYDRATDGETLAYVAMRNCPDQSHDISGFLIARRIVDEVEILNFAVAPGLRRRGIGAALIDHAFRSPALVGVCRAFLEVRASNYTAIKFYKSHGFEITGTRRNYYSSPMEDALLLRRSIRTAT